MRVLTEDAVVVCTHQLGSVERRPSQDLVRVDGRRLLVDDDPVGRSIHLCPNYGVTVKPCNKSLAVTVGYSELLRIDGKRVCLDTMRGLTDGTPPSVVEYEVKDAGQTLVESAA
jgi:hypothetical protein